MPKRKKSDASARRSSKKSSLQLTPGKWYTSPTAEYPYIGETCRRVIPPPFINRLAKEDYYNPMSIKLSSTGGTISANSATPNGCAGSIDGYQSGIIRLSDGIVVGYSPENLRERIPALYRVRYSSYEDGDTGDNGNSSYSPSPSTPIHLFKNLSSSSESPCHAAFTEDLTLQELLNGMAMAKKRINSSLSSSDLVEEQTKQRYYERNMHALVMGQVRSSMMRLLPGCVLAAVQEMELERVVKDYVKHRLSADGDENDGDGTELSTGENDELDFGRYAPFSEEWRRKRTAALRSMDNNGGDGKEGCSGIAVTNLSSKDSENYFHMHYGSAIKTRISLGANLLYEQLLRHPRLAENACKNSNGKWEYSFGSLEPGGRVAITILHSAFAQLHEQNKPQQTSQDQLCSTEDNKVDLRNIADAMKKISTKDVLAASVLLIYDEEEEEKKRRALVRKQKHRQKVLLQQQQEHQDNYATMSGVSANNDTNREIDVEQQLTEEGEEVEEVVASLKLLNNCPYRLQFHGVDINNEFLRSRFSLVIPKSKEDEDNSASLQGDKHADSTASNISVEEEIHRRRVQDKLVQMEEKRVRDRERDLRLSGWAIWPQWKEEANAVISRIELEAMRQQKQQQQMTYNSGDSSMTGDVRNETMGSNKTASSQQTSGDGGNQSLHVVSNTKGDEAMARSLTVAEQNEPTIDPTTATRRSRRAQNNPHSVVTFYGSVSAGLSPSQVQDSILRLIQQRHPSCLTLHDLRTALLSEILNASYDENSLSGSNDGQNLSREVRKIRTGLLKLFYGLGRIGRVTVGVSEENGVEAQVFRWLACWKRKDQYLIGVDLSLMAQGSETSNTTEVANIETDAQPSDNGIIIPKEEDFTSSHNEQRQKAATIMATVKPLLSYIQSIHETEILLRSLVLKQIQIASLSPRTIAGAADDDDVDEFEQSSKSNSDDDDDQIAQQTDRWQNDAQHELRGKFLLRPDMRRWIVHKYCPPVLLESDTIDTSKNPSVVNSALNGAVNGDGSPASSENQVVKCRARFFCIPQKQFQEWQQAANKKRLSTSRRKQQQRDDNSDPSSSSSSSDSEIVDETKNSDKNETEDFEKLILTEAQVRAGMDALVLLKQQRLPPFDHLFSSENTSSLNTSKGATKNRRRCRDTSQQPHQPPQVHPIKNRIGSRLTLHFVDENNDATETHQQHLNPPIFGTVVGYSMDPSNNNCDTQQENRILILPDEPPSQKVDPKNLCVTKNESHLDENECSDSDEPNINSTQQPIAKRDVVDDINKLDFDSMLSIMKKAMTSYPVMDNNHQQKNDTNSSNKQHFIGEDCKPHSESMAATNDEKKAVSVPTKNAFWASLVDNCASIIVPSNIIATATTSDVHSLQHMKIKVTWHAGSNPSMEEARILLDWLQNHSKSSPFLEPVDPIALNLPDYTTVIKHPMDISTLSHDLLSGKHNNSNGSIDLTTGPNGGSFAKDLNRIFENAMSYNAAGSWIYNSALWLQKNSNKKLEAAAKRCRQTTGRAFDGRIKTNNYEERNRPKYSEDYFEEEDDCSAAEEEEYVDDEHDEEEEEEDVVSSSDDEYDNNYCLKKRRKKRKRSSKKSKLVGSSGKIAAADAALVGIIQIPLKFHEIVTLVRDSFLDTHVASFSLPMTWRCCRRGNASTGTPSNSRVDQRYTQNKTGELTENKNGNADNDQVACSSSDSSHNQDVNEMILLMAHMMEQQTATTTTRRRTTRQRQQALPRTAITSLAVPTRNSGRRNRNANSKNQFEVQNLEYFLADESSLRPLSQSSFAVSQQSVCASNRNQVELVQESIHEYYAKLYRDYQQYLITDCFSLVENDDDTRLPPHDGSKDAKDEINESSSELIFSNNTNQMEVSAGSVVLPNTQIKPNTKNNLKSLNYGSFHKHIFPPYLGRVCPKTCKWEIRSQSLQEAVRWVIQGLLQSGHLGGDIDGISTSTSITISNAYYASYKVVRPLDVVETLNRKSGGKNNKDEDIVEEENDIEISAYEAARRERVARNQERLKALGLG